MESSGGRTRPVGDELEVVEGAIVNIQGRLPVGPGDGGFAGVQEAEKLADSNISGGRALFRNEEVEGQVRSVLNGEGKAIGSPTTSWNPSGNLIGLLWKCGRLGIDVSRISYTETVSASETYRMRLEALVLAKEMEDAEKWRRSQENAEKEIQDLESRKAKEISAKEEEIQELKDLMQAKEERIRAQSMEIRHLEEALGIRGEQLVAGGRGEEANDGEYVPEAWAYPTPSVTVPPREPYCNLLANNLNGLAQGRRRRTTPTACKSSGILHSRIVRPSARRNRRL